MLDRRLHSVGVANSLARSKGWQARILWIDATANVERYNTSEKIRTLVAKIAETGFNTIILDVKPISGHVIYPSNFAPKLTEWRGRKLPIDFDPLPDFCREAKALKVQLFLSLNAFSEGHNLMKVGPGFAKPEWQTVLYEPKPFVELGFQRLPVASEANTAPNSESLSVFTNSVELAKIPPSGFAVSVDALGSFIDGFELLPNSALPTIPRLGCVIVSTGELAIRLRIASIGATQVRFQTEPNLIPAGKRPKDQFPLMTNPLNPEVLTRNGNIVRELASKYEIAGIVYDDRLRFAGLNADFSPESRAAFENWLNRKLVKWPQDVYEVTYSPNFSQGLKPGPEYENWLVFRAFVIQRYVVAISDLLKSTRPGAQFGVYAGSWYGEYSAYGTNYAGPSLDAGFWFLSSEYQKTGIADKIDFLTTGCYYPTPTIFEAMSTGRGVGQSVESAAALTNRVANDATWTYAGISLEQFSQNPKGLANALQAATGATQGVMVFDLSHNIEPMWPVFQQAFRKPAKSPNFSSLSVLELRKKRAQAIASGWKPPAVVISTGQPGAGH